MKSHCCNAKGPAHALSRVYETGAQSWKKEVAYSTLPAGSCPDIEAPST